MDRNGLLFVELMMSYRYFSDALRLLAVCAGLLIAPLTVAQNASATVGTLATQTKTSTSLIERYPAGSIQSVETADRALAEADQERARAEAQYAEDKRICYPKFFTTACLDDATERRRHDLAQIRPVEIEANLFLRRQSVLERDKALAEKRAQQEAEVAQRLQQQQEHETAAAQKIQDRAQQEKSVAANQKAHAADTSKRVAEHEAKLQRLQAEQVANAKKRADNVSQYEKKVKESEARQREVAAKKAEKQRDRAAAGKAPLPSVSLPPASDSSLASPKP